MPEYIRALPGCADEHAKLEEMQIMVRGQAAPSEGTEAGRGDWISDLADLENLLQREPLSQWADLATQDPTASVFQSPMWCMPWYRAYREIYTPLVLAVTQEDRLVGVAPMAREIATGRLCFAGDSIADYRDVVALPAYREGTLREFLKKYHSGRFPNMLWFGPTMPESETVDMLMGMSESCGVNAIRRSHTGWRWWPSEMTAESDPLKKKSVRYKINYFRRQGTLTVKVVQTVAEWDAFKEEYYRQNSFRQLFGGRQITFQDERKRAFFDSLFSAPCAHVIGLYANGELIASHFGSIYRDVLYWGAPSFDARQKQYSPGLLLLVLTMQEATAWGLRGIDLTVGEGDLKERFSTSHVELPSVELYPAAKTYYIRKAQVAVNSGARNLAARYGGPEQWKKLKPLRAKIAFKAMRARELGVGGIARQVGSRIAGAFGERTRGLVLIATPETFRPVDPAMAADESCCFHDNQMYDLLKAPAAQGEVARLITAQAANFVESARTGRTLHTILVDDRLAGWGYSYWPKEPARLSETGGTLLEFLPQSVSLYGFFVLPEFRGKKLYQALLSHILRQRWAEGAERAYIGVLASNTPSKKAIERVGFQTYKINDVTRFLKWRRLHTRTLF